MRKKQIVFMSPDKVLRNMPHPASLKLGSAATAEEKFFDKGSIKYLTKKYKSTKKIPKGHVFLDYSRMYYGYPTHEGRHTAYVARKLKIKKIPVEVIK